MAINLWISIGLIQTHHPVMVTERLAGKSKYAGKLYLKFETEDSWTRPGVRMFGRINGGLTFETAHILDKRSVP